MLVAAAVLPHPPVLVPALSSGAAGELDDLRAGCTDAVAQVMQRSADVTYVIGVDGGPRARSFRPWGANVPVDVPEPLPLPLLVGAWLTAGTARSFVVVDDGLDAAECAEAGRELAASADRVAFLVMGDGSARHSEKAPGYLDPRAAGFDDDVTAALRAGNSDALLQLDPVLARDLLVAGRAPWQVLAGAARGQCMPASATVVDDIAPYGVLYRLVTWSWQEAAQP